MWGHETKQRDSGYNMQKILCLTTKTSEDPTSGFEGVSKGGQAVNQDTLREWQSEGAQEAFGEAAPASLPPASSPGKP